MFWTIKKIDPAKLGGWVFQGGNFGLLALGGYRGDWSQLGAAATWITTAEILRKRGDDPKWFARSCVTAIVAIGLTNYDELKTVNVSELASLSSPATATVIGTGLYALGYGVFGAFSKPLTQAFKDAKNITVRWTMGHPRLITGILAITSMLPMIRDTIVDKNIGTACIIASFLLGEALIAASSPDRPTNEAILHQLEKLTVDH